MPEQFPSCFGACYSGVASPSAEAGPNLTTSIYETRLGVAALTWSRALLGLTLAADLCLSDPDEEDADSLRFRVRPWFLWNQRGSRRFSLINDRSSRRCVDFTWDLSHARFCTGSGARSEPASRFFVAISVDSEMLLVAGDLIEEAYKKSRARRPPAAAPFSIPAAPTSRREHVGLGGPGGRRSYRTVARLGGRERVISIDLGVKEKDWEEGMAVSVDGKRILHVRRLRWKFRGTEKVEVEGGGWIQVSWDLYSWLFQTKNDSATSPLAENQRAMFIFRLEEDQTRNPDGVHSGNKGTTSRNLHGKTNEWSESSSNYGGRGTVRMRQRRSRSLLQKTTSSSSSTSSASSASSSTVLEWASQEEEELQRHDGFSLLVYIWKNSIT
ncbi:uncharacterized protein LOC122052951 [Zingiber officinale]|uniref:DUF868 family protein n=1 Tax=Zingiber officinale TaxID=94328 RepID=A0A8J5HEI6_ZINOF|nr:uncharacterized protein LOC122052951 [Zingiber officinale]KAG6522506.1 hypothetical protein ZIOFF_019646 [Zingiber officinale]